MSQLKVEGTRGAAIAKMGVNLNYPHGEPDALEVSVGRRRSGRRCELRGSWFIEAFEGPMSNLQRFAAGEDQRAGLGRGRRVPDHGGGRGVLRIQRARRDADPECGLTFRRPDQFQVVKLIAR